MKNSLLTCLKRFGIEIVDKIEIYNLAGRFYCPNLISRGVFVAEDTVDGGVVEKMLICDILLTKEQIEGILKLQN
jgi:hypothetical protein